MENKRIIVTGAAGGLGTVLVSMLLERGVRVTGLVKTEEEAETLSSRIASDNLSTLVLDLAETDGIAGIIAGNIAAEGPAYGLVNNAAIYPKAEIDAISIPEIRDVLTVNALGAAALVKGCLPGMKALGAGRIVNIASNTFDMGMVGLSAYVGSKGASIGFARVWARELGRFGITVNVVSPGAFRTDAEAIHPNPEAYSQFVIDQQAIKRRGDPREFAYLVAFLLSDEAGFITGQNIRVDGGWVTQ